MGKRIYWVLLLLIIGSGVWTMVHYGRQPRSETILRLQVVEKPADWSALLTGKNREKLRASPVLFLGVEADQAEHFEIWKEFLNSLQDPGLKYDVIVMDQELTSPLFADVPKISTKMDFENFAQGVQSALSQNQRVAVILPTVYAVQKIEANVVSNYKLRTQSTPLSLSVTDLPRTREEEKHTRYACAVEGVDRTGLGPFGCLVLQVARGSYRNRFPSGSKVGLIHQISESDLLILTTSEK